MRVALVSEVFLPAVDGVVRRLQRTLEELDRLGQEVTVIAPAGGPPAYASAPVVDMPALRVPLYPDGDGYPEKRVSLPGPALGEALRRIKPDVIHAVNPFLLAAGAVYYAGRLSRPLVASFHANVPQYANYYRLGWLESFGWRYVRALHGRAALNLCTSRATLSALRARGIERLELWPYGIELDSFDPGLADPSWRRRLSGGHSDRLVLLYVGRLAKEKQIERLVPTLRRRDDLTLAIVGDGPERCRLEREFAGTSTQFLGLLTGEDLTRAYASADAFVFPSTSETLGMVILEAHASGLPVLAADSPVAQELVRDGVDGLLFCPHDSCSLGAAVQELLDHPAARAEMSRRARRSVSNVTLTWNGATRRLLEFYERVAADGVPAGAPR